MNYTGEHLFPGQLGHFFAILSLVASLVAAISFYKSFKLNALNQKQNWVTIGRIAFALQTIAILGMFITLYFIISNHYFEYKYAWQHSSRNLQVEYLLSCFWEGQEGAFMLWSFWLSVLGWVLIWKAKNWEGPVMTVMSFFQFALATMLLGIYFFGTKIGTSPFVLLRNEMDAPIFSRPDYLQFVKDGNGLNALLQNYWMVIHPPILFLGFASTIVPFAYAMGGFMTRDHKGWTTPALPWGLFSIAILGTGIMMGAAWAYESLTFGGYWAWDPVENASLVPWLIMVGGVHTNLVFKNSGYSLKSTYLFYVLSFVLILYSTFLTRSGVLGDTSVHAFTDLGMNVQLFLFLNVFIWVTPFTQVKGTKNKLLIVAAFVTTNALSLSLPYFSLISAILGIVIMGWLLAIDKEIPTIHKEENVYSREFWMYIASLVFFLSAIVISAKTSLPVFNKLFATKIAPPEDVEFSHNQIQIWIAIIAGILTSVTQYLRYKDTPQKAFYKKILLPAAIALVCSLLISFLVGIDYSKQGIGFQISLHIGVFAAVFAIIANASYIWLGLKGKLKVSGASIAHIGFGMVLLGILISASNKEVLSINTTGISPLKADEKENSYENTTLIKGVATDMGKYMVTYIKDTLNPEDRKRYYEIDFREKKGKDGFKLYPDVIENNKGAEGLTPNPDSKHYLGRDIFSYVTFLSDPEKKKSDTTSFKNKTVIIGDTSFYSNGMWVVNQLEFNPDDARFKMFPNDTLLAADISVIAKDGRLYKSKPAFRLHGNQIEMLPDTVMSQSLVFALIKPGDPAKKEVEIGIKESNAILDFITLKVYEFPAINVLWLGIMVMVIGTVMSIIRRIQLMQRKN
ncbi:MAG: cytochrome c biogenesis protein CcsA [Bacteroidota bacterium]